MLEEDKSGVRQVSHTYDGAYEQGLLSTTTDSDGVVTSYGYTKREELASASEAGITTNYSYYADGHEQTINDPLGNYATKTWDNDGRLLSGLTNKNPSGGYLSGYGYGYNGDNQKTSCAEYGYNGASYANVAWRYDPLGHLSSETRSGGSPWNASYTVDGVGNRTSQTINGVTTGFSYDNDDELTGDTVGGYYTYDANGNLNGQRRNGGWIYPYYTNENQIAVIYTGGQSPAYNYNYDALGRQVARVDTSGTRTDYQYDGQSVLTEKQNGSTTSRYLRGSNLLAKYGEAPQLDGLGSMRQGLDQSSGRYTGQTDYSAFGQVIGGNNPGAFQSVYQWGAQSGYRMDGPSGGGGDAGLVKVGARYYDPADGRFTSRDSDISQAAYAYCNGDPVNFTDPSGHSWLSSIFKGLGKVVTGAANSLVKNLGTALYGTARYLLQAQLFEFAVIAIAPEFAALGLVGTTGAVSVGLLAGAISGYATAALTGEDRLKSIIGASLVGGLFSGLEGGPDPGPAPTFPIPIELPDPRTHPGTP